MISILYGIFALVIVGATGTFVYIVSSESRNDSAANSSNQVHLKTSPGFGAARRSTALHDHY